MVQRKAVSALAVLAAGLASLGHSGALPAAAAAVRGGATPPLLDELRKNFTIGGKPVPPEVFRDLGDGDMADSTSIRVTIDANAAIGSNLYFDPVKVVGDWIFQSKAAGKDESAEQTGYRFVGSTKNGLLVAVASYSSGGSGVFYTLHILDAGMARGFDSEGNRYERIDVTDVRSIPLGDRWDGTVRIAGNSVTITTTGGVAVAGDRKPTTRVIEAERP